MCTYVRLFCVNILVLCFQSILLVSEEEKHISLMFHLSTLLFKTSVRKYNNTPCYYFSLPNTLQNKITTNEIWEKISMWKSDKNVLDNYVKWFVTPKKLMLFFLMLWISKSCLSQMVKQVHF